MKHTEILLAIAAVFVSNIVDASASIITATDAKTVRVSVSWSGVLDSLAVKRRTEDRAILEFDVSSIDAMMPQIMLNIWFDNIDPEPPVGIIDVFIFTGDGVVTLDDYYAGGMTPFLSFIAENGPEYGYVSIDVTSAVQAIIASGDQYAGFRLSTVTDDRLNIGWLTRLPDPVLTLVPEPATVVLLGLGAVMLRKRRTE